MDQKLYKNGIDCLIYLITTKHNMFFVNKVYFKGLCILQVKYIFKLPNELLDTLKTL